MTPLVRVAARRAGFLDAPGPGKPHREPVPTLGGLAVAASVLATLAGLQLAESGIAMAHAVGLAVAALPILAVGVLDDLRPRGAITRLLAHFLAGGILYAYGLRVTELTNPFGTTLPLGLFGPVVTLLWVAAVINALNLVDGLDGLAAGIGIIAATSFAVVGVLKDERDVLILSVVLAGALLGFVPFNLPRARIFLGDVGSTFVGLVLATIALVENRKTTAAMTLLLPIVALGLPVLDTVLAVVRRTAHGRNPLDRDLGHLHHRLLRLGLGPLQALLCLLAVTAGFGAVAILLAGLGKQAALLVTLGLALATVVALVVLSALEARVGSGRS